MSKKNTKSVGPKKIGTKKVEKKKILTSKKMNEPKKVAEKISGKISEIIEEEFVPTAPKPKMTTPYMSVYEYCALINARAVQLGSTPENGPRVPIERPEDYDPLLIATREIHAGLVTLIIRRTLPDGTTEDWDPKEMIFPRI